VGSHEKVLHINELLTMHMGPEFILVNISVDFRDPITAPEIEEAVSEIDGMIKGAFPAVRRVFIEAEARAK
jgi:divalent metal cation (Fe/Co/Zn/Cd) transporter